MKKCGFFLFVLALVFAASYASAEGLYVRGSIGASSVNDSTVTVQGLDSAEIEFDTGLLLGGAIGSDLGNNVRVEGEVAYSTADVDKVDGNDESDLDIDGLSFLVNCYYDIKSDSPVTPFIGAGIGFANLEINDPDESDDARCLLIMLAQA